MSSKKSRKPTAKAPGPKADKTSQEQQQTHTTLGLDLAAIRLHKEINLRRHARQVLDEAEEKYRWIVENTSEGIVVIQNGRFQFVNRRTAVVLRKRAEGLIGSKFDQYVHPDDRETVFHHYDAFDAGQTDPNPYDFRILTRAGRTHWIRNNPVGVRWEGKPALLCFLSDITEHKEAEIEIRRSRERLDQLVHSIPVMITMYDQKGNVSLVNDKLTEVLGWTEEDFKKTPPMELCYPDKDMREKVWQFMTSGEEGWRNFGVTSKSGARIASAWTNVYLDTGEAIGIGIDMREQVESDLQLREAYDQLETERNLLAQKNIALSELLSQFEQQKHGLHENVARNIEESILPIVDMLKEKATGEILLRNLEFLEKELLDVTSPLMSRLKLKFDRLTPREREVCRLIKHGHSTDEIAATLDLSVATVQKYRELIRRKLDLTGKKLNLSTFLRSMDE